MFFIFSSRRRHTRWPRDWSSDVCSSDLVPKPLPGIRTVQMGRLVVVRGDGEHAGQQDQHVVAEAGPGGHQRSEERRVGKECRTRWRATKAERKNENEAIWSATHGL